MVKGEKVLQSVPLIEFFRERVQKAMANQQIVASAYLEFYLVNLLQEFKKTEKLFESHGSKMFEKPLALILADAVHADANTKIRCLKKLGDTSLYIAGFFGESLKRKIIDIDYYIRMGGTAYQSLSQLLTYQKTFAELYAELSNHFPNLVGVLTEVSLTKDLKTNRDLLKLYERWLTTGEEHIENILKKAGIVMNLITKPQ